MAEKIIRKLIDDMEDGEVPADGTVLFGLDGKNFEIDLSKKNADTLRAFLNRYIPNSRQAGKAPRQHKVSQASVISDYNPEQRKAMRDWARKNGWPELSDRGRVPADAIEAFEKSHRGEGLFSNPGA